jgi:GLPGLI family protein
MRIIFFAFCFVFTGNIFAQEIYGEATYASKTKVDMSWMDENRDITPERRKMIEKNMKQFTEKTYVLKFNRNEAEYSEVKELAAPSQGRNWGSFMGSAMGGTKYKNLKENLQVEQRDMFGKLFLIKDSLPALDWKVTGESRTIGNYMVVKATAYKPVDEMDWSNWRRRRQSEKKDSVAVAEGDMEKLYEKPDSVMVTAWFTPQIPVQHGPGEYAGLPGLIMEVSEGNTTILLTEIKMNPEDREELKPETKGEVVTMQEYSTTFTEKMREMRERFSRGGRSRR